MYCIQHCFICRPSDATVSEDAGIEPRVVATSALAVRRSNNTAIYLIQIQLDLISIIVNFFKIILHILTRTEFQALKSYWPKNSAWLEVKLSSIATIVHQAGQICFLSLVCISQLIAIEWEEALFCWPLAFGHTCYDLWYTEDMRLFRVGRHRGDAVGAS